jgi:uncharacterized protein (TIGR03437 family)
VSLTVGNPPPSIRSVVNGASFAAGPVAPGEIVTVFGSALGPDTAVAWRVSPSGQLDSVLSGTRVLFDELPAPLVYVSATQVSAIVPYAVAGRLRSQLRIESATGKSQEVAVDVSGTAPGVFTMSGTGAGPGAVLNQSLSVNSDANPAPRGGVVVIYATGEGQTNPPGIDGRITGTPLNTPLRAVAVTIGGRNAEVLYAGSAPGLVAGLLQINARVPEDAGGGAVPVTISIGGQTSQAGVTVAIQK